MKKKSNEKKFKEFLKSLKDVQVCALYLILYEEMCKRGFIEWGIKI